MNTCSLKNLRCSLVLLVAVSHALPDIPHIRTSSFHMELGTSLTARALVLRQVLDWFPKCWGKTSFLSRSTLGSQSCPLSNNYFCSGSRVRCCFTLYMSLLLICWSFPSPPPLPQLTQAGICHLGICISIPWVGVTWHPDQMYVHHCLFFIITASELLTNL